MGASFDQTVIEEIIKRGGWAFKTFPSPYQMKGLPDIIGTYGGRPLYLEDKVRSDKDRALQIAILKKVRRTHPMAVADIVRSVERLREILDAIDRGEPWIGEELK